MADWKDKFRKGSFRGVPFKIERSTVTGGRRKQDREFAKRDLGNSEDLGRRLKTFALELLVIGDDYFAQRDALEDALNTKGPGELIHPYRGTLKVQAGNYILNETVNEGRLARFSVEFTEAGEIKFPDQVQDDLNQSIDNAEALKDASASVFENIFSVAAQPAFVVESATAKIDAVVDFADNAVKKVTEPVTNFTFALRNIKASVSDLIKTPGKLAAQLRDAFDLLLDEFINEPETSERIFGNFKTLGDDPAFVPVVGNTPSRNKEQENQDAVLNLTNQLVLGNQTQAAVDVDFISTNAALQSRNEIVQGLDTQLDIAGDDDLFQAIKDLQTSLTRALPRTGVTELIDIELKKTIPALVIAYNEFEDLNKEDEIVDQNNIEHPGFVPGGETIQVSAS